MYLALSHYILTCRESIYEEEYLQNCVNLSDIKMYILVQINYFLLLLQIERVGFFLIISPTDPFPLRQQGSFWNPEVAQRALRSENLRWNSFVRNGHICVVYICYSTRLNMRTSFVFGVLFNCMESHSTVG